MSGLSRQGNWPMNHRNQVPVIDAMLARMAEITKRLDEVAAMVAPGPNSDREKGEKE